MLHKPKTYRHHIVSLNHPPAPFLQEDNEHPPAPSLQEDNQHHPAPSLQEVNQHPPSPTSPSPSEDSTLPDHPPGPFLPEDTKQSTRPYLSDHPTLPEHLDGPSLLEDPTPPHDSALPKYPDGLSLLKDPTPPNHTATGSSLPQYPSAQLGLSSENYLSTPDVTDSLFDDRLYRTVACTYMYKSEEDKDFDVSLKRTGILN